MCPPERLVLAHSALTLIVSSDAAFDDRRAELDAFTSQRYSDPAVQTEFVQPGLARIMHLCETLWHWLEQPVMHPNDGLALATTAYVGAGATLRGAGLVASAYGMLHCRGAVAALVARWQDGPWVGRLDTPADVVVSIASLRDPPVATRDGDEEAAELRFGRWAPGQDANTCLQENNTPDGLRNATASLRTLAPHALGGGRAALVLHVTHLPPAASGWRSSRPRLKRTMAARRARRRSRGAPGSAARRRGLGTTRACLDTGARSRGFAAQAARSRPWRGR
jgi:hypothetical protein